MSAMEINPDTWKIILFQRIVAVLHLRLLLYASRTNDGMASPSSSKLERVSRPQLGRKLTVALNEQKTEIRIQFNDVTSGIFKDIPRNELVIRVQPNEAVYLKMNTKLPGLTMRTATTEVTLNHSLHPLRLLLRVCAPRIVTDSSLI